MHKNKFKEEIGLFSHGSDLHTRTYNISKKVFLCLVIKLYLLVGQLKPETFTQTYEKIWYGACLCKYSKSLIFIQTFGYCCQTACDVYFAPFFLHTNIHLKLQASISNFSLNSTLL